MADCRQYVTQFSLKVMLLSVALLAGGLCLLKLAFGPNTVTGEVGEAICGFGSFVLIGAGLMMPFGKPWIGAAISVGLSLAMAVLAICLVGWQ
jgi:hypothetical protein